VLVTSAVLVELKLKILLVKHFCFSYSTKLFLKLSNAFGQILKLIRQLITFSP